MPIRIKKRFILLSVIILLTVAVAIGALIFTSNKSDNTDNTVNEEVIDQANAVVLDDIYVDSIESIKLNYKDDPKIIFAALAQAGYQKVYVGRDAEAIPYFKAAYEYALNDEQRVDIEIRIFNSAQKSNNEALAEEYKEKLGDKLINPTVTGSQQYVE